MIYAKILAWGLAVTGAGDISPATLSRLGKDAQAILHGRAAQVHRPEGMEFGPLETRNAFRTGDDLIRFKPDIGHEFAEPDFGGREMKGFGVPLVIAAGIAVGLAICIIPIEFNIFVVIILSTIALHKLVNGPKVARIRAVAMTALALATVVVCFALSPSHHECKVGPASYQNLTLKELLFKLRNDFDIRCSALGEVQNKKILRFDIPVKMSRMDVMKKLASETGTRFRFGGYCGNGMTVMFGAYPMSSWLESPALSEHK